MRPYAVLSEARLRVAEQRIAEAMQDWCAQWGMAAPPKVSARRAWETTAPAEGWSHAQQAAGRAAWLAWGPHAATQLQRQLFAPDAHATAPVAPPARLAPRAAQAALQALADCLLALGCGAGGTEAKAPPPSWRSHASGFVQCTLQLGAWRAELLLNHAALCGLGAAAPVLPALAPVDHAAVLGPLPLRLAVTAGSARVGLGSLLQLQAGDVIRLDRAAAALLAVSLPQGGELFRGYLGISEQQLALDVVARPSA